MKTIYKYPFKVNPTSEVELPKDAKILLVDLLDLNPCIWALVDTDNEKVTRKFYICATGQPIAINTSKYITTFIDGAYVWHMFEDV